MPKPFVGRVREGGRASVSVNREPLYSPGRRPHPCLPPQGWKENAFNLAARAASSDQQAETAPHDVRLSPSDKGSKLLVDLDPIAVRVLQVHGPHVVRPRLLFSLRSGSVAVRRAPIPQMPQHSREVRK